MHTKVYRPMGLTVRFGAIGVNVTDERTGETLTYAPKRVIREGKTTSKFPSEEWSEARKVIRQSAFV